MKHDQDMKHGYPHTIIGIFPMIVLGYPMKYGLSVLGYPHDSPNTSPQLHIRSGAPQFKITLSHHSHCYDHHRS